MNKYTIVSGNSVFIHFLKIILFVYDVPTSVAHPREFAIDTSIIRRVAEMGTQQAEGIRIDTFDKEEFMKKLVCPMIYSPYLCCL